MDMGKIMEPGLYNMDCMEAMQLFPDGFFDLAIVDPPYGGGAAETPVNGNVNMPGLPSTPTPSCSIGCRRGKRANDSTRRKSPWPCIIGC